MLSAITILSRQGINFFADRLAHIYVNNSSYGYFLSITCLFFILLSLSFVELHSTIAFDLSKIRRGVYIFLCLYFIVHISFLLFIIFYKIHYSNLQLISYDFTLIYFFLKNVQLHTNYYVHTNTLTELLLLLMFLTGFICLHLLNTKDLNKSLYSFVYFFMFQIGTILMVSTTNILIMFLSFELIFLPTLYFVWNVNYSKKADKSTYYLFTWTFFGSLLVLWAIIYIFKKKNSLEFNVLKNTTFTLYEEYSLFLLIFIGFGIKIPIFPFHFWLTKIHVEASAGFSIFLSGFLVKTALYCFYMLYILVSTPFLKKVLILLTIIGICESSFKMWFQIDFKKLIAYATIQEMNMIFLLMLTNVSVLNTFFIYFFFFHGLLAILFFYLVDILQKRYNTRNIYNLHGLLIQDFKIAVHLLISFFIYCGFPLTIKFIIELYLLNSLFEALHVFGVFIFLIAIVAGVIGFGKTVFTILYGVPQILEVPVTLSRVENSILLTSYLFIYLIYFLVSF